MLGFLRGDGFDKASMQRALELEDPTLFAPIALRPALLNALLLDWTGQLDRANSEMRAIQRRCTEVGEEGELVLIAFYVGLNTIWRGDFAKANLVAEDAMERARQLGGHFPLFAAMILRAWLAAFAGREDEARHAIADALAVFEQLDTPLWAARARTELTRLDVTSQSQQGLTAAEQRVAELAASGMTNRDVAGALFISPKTVEATLARVYRKLGIRSRAELGRRMGKARG
jgi:DNA-binding CsgD family transcriptional regulator